jgi:hypothetical protein
VTITADESGNLQALDADVARAWNTYRTSTEQLAGDAYQRAEPELWQLLQDRLDELEHQRRELLAAGRA